jgi:hypothetical protein
MKIEHLKKGIYYYYFEEFEKKLLIEEKNNLFHLCFDNKGVVDWILYMD